MGMPDYSSSNYDAAEKKYKELQAKYTGEKGFESASQQATQLAQQQGQTAGAVAQSNARSSGMTRAQSAAMGAAQSAKSTVEGYQNAQNQALANNQNALNSQNVVMQNAQTKDDRRYSNDSNKYSAVVGGIGGVLKGIADGMSDCNAKDIKASTKDADYYLNKLRG